MRNETLAEIKRLKEMARGPFPREDAAKSFVDEEGHFDEGAYMDFISDLSYFNSDIYKIARHVEMLEKLDMHNAILDFEFLKKPFFEFRNEYAPLLSIILEKSPLTYEEYNKHDKLRLLLYDFFEKLIKSRLNEKEPE